MRKNKSVGIWLGNRVWVNRKARTILPTNWKLQRGILSKPLRPVNIK